MLQFISVYCFCVCDCNEWASVWLSEYSTGIRSSTTLTESSLCAHCPWTSMSTNAWLQLCLACFAFVYSTSFQVPLSAADQRNSSGLQKGETHWEEVRDRQTGRQTDALWCVSSLEQGQGNWHVTGWDGRDSHQVFDQDGSEHLWNQKVHLSWEHFYHLSLCKCFMFDSLTADGRCSPFSQKQLGKRISPAQVCPRRLICNSILAKSLFLAIFCHSNCGALAVRGTTATQHQHFTLTGLSGVSSCSDWLQWWIGGEIHSQIYKIKAMFFSKKYKGLKTSSKIIWLALISKALALFVLLFNPNGRNRHASFKVPMKSRVRFDIAYSQWFY